MSNLESPGANSSRGLGGIEDEESSDAAAQLSTPNGLYELLEESREALSSFDSMFWEDIASDDDLAAPIDFASSRPLKSKRNDLKRKAAIPNHKGVHFRQKNKKFVSRLCLPGGKSRKLELGEYNTQDEAVRAYHVGAFYYNKPCTCNCGEDKSFSDNLGTLPENLSDAGRQAWVRESARKSAAIIGTSESPPIFTSRKRMLESGGSSFDARPSTPASYGTQGSCDDHHSTPTTPTTSGSADPDNSFWGSGAKGPRATMLEEMGEDRVDSVRGFPGDALVNRREGKSAAPHNTSESQRRRCFQTRSQESPNVELQQGRNSYDLTNQTAVVDHQAVSQVKLTDSILFALVELRKQGWECTLKLRSPRSVEAGVLLSLPRGEHAASALRITDIITNSFDELREQGWEVHLQPHGGGDVERYSGRGGVQVVVKFSYAKQKLVWELLESGQRRKVEIDWSDIGAMEATCSDISAETLQIEVFRPPLFFQAAMVGSSWQACPDFTKGQASVCRFHVLRFPRGVLKEHYEKLVQCDPRLKAADIRGRMCLKC